MCGVWRNPSLGDQRPFHPRPQPAAARVDGALISTWRTPGCFLRLAAKGPGGRCPAARGLVPVVGFAGAPVGGASVIQQLSCYGVLADSHLTSPRSTQSPGPPPLPCGSSLRRRPGSCHPPFRQSRFRRSILLAEPGGVAPGLAAGHPVGGHFGLSRAPITEHVSNLELHVTPAPMTLLSGGVPLSLLLDLVLGPNSEDLLIQEHLSDIRETYE